MEPSHPEDIVVIIGNSNSSDLNETNAADTNNDTGNELTENTTEDGKTANSGDGDEGIVNIDDDQECVVIEEAINKTIELDDDSSDELELQVIAGTEASPNVGDNSAKATEFVIVNAANLSIPVVPSETASVEKYGVGDLQLKDELAETVTADLNTNDVLENDPMDLLELNNRSECSSSVKSHEDTDYNDDVSSLGSSSVKTGSSSSVSVFDWVKDHPWLLYEEGDDPFGYCLYCDAKMNIKSQRSVKQHGLSLYHKERCENYLAFREEEEKNGLGVNLAEIKEEFGTDSRVEALKLKRKSQSASLNNFNWRRWLEEYPWLERNSTEGTVGLCKYCKMHVNVEFSYLRDRHQEGNKHKEAEKHYGESNEPEPQNEPTADDEQEDEEEAEEKQSAAAKNRGKSHQWLQVVKNRTNMVLCKLCGFKMFKNNFLRHLGSNLHKNNENMYLKNQNNTNKTEVIGKSTKNWKPYAKYHPWMVADPIDPTLAYCKYCEKRFYYGASATKRSRHENSSHHKQNEIEFKKRSRKANTSKNDESDSNEQNGKDQVKRRAEEEDEDQNEENEENNEDGDDDKEGGDGEGDGDNEEDNDEENEDKSDDEDNEEGKEIDDDNDCKKRISRLSDEWLSQYPWCRKYEKDPKNFMFCIYCKIPLSMYYSRLKHQSTSFHVSSEKQFLSQKNKKQENVPFFEWAVPLKNDSSSYSCRYCRVRISKNYSKKQHAASKVHQINETIHNNNNSRMSLRNDENDEKKVDTELQNVASSKKIVIKAPSTVTLIKQMQKRFDWLSYKRSELRSHYGHCKICDCSVYIRSVKHVLRHLRSGRHISIMKANKKQKVEKDQDDDDDDDDEKSANTIKRGTKDEMQSSPSQTENVSQNQTMAQAFEYQKSCNYKSTITEMKKRFSWIEKSEIPNYAFCRFCNLNIPLKVIFLRNHSNSPKHRRCVVNNYSVDKKKFNKEACVTKNTAFDKSDDKCDEIDNDVIIVEDNNEEILISEQDENWTVKSEIMDEHEELDYLLQRSFNNTSNVQRNARNNRIIDSEPAPKRAKRSHSFRRLNDSNSSLVASLLTTPLTLASCLGPIIQQQIQQQTHLSQAVQANYNAPTAPDPQVAKISAISVVESENTYDLFFKSISETIKKLPVDLAAEGKLKVMQVICDLELQALKREQSERSEPEPNSIGNGLNYQAQSTNILSVCSSSVPNDVNSEQLVNGNETIITQINMNSPPSTTSLLPEKATNASNVEQATTSPAPSPLIGLMDKNGLQTLQFKTAVAKQIPKTTTASPVTPVPSSGIRCIPFKNLSQPSTPDSTNSKIARIQVPVNMQTPPNATSNANSANNSKNLLNFRNLQITKRIGIPPTSGAQATGTQQTVQKSTSATTKSPQRNFITNIQPQLQRWSCPVNGSSAHHSPSSPAVNHLQQLSSQQTSTPISKK